MHYITTRRPPILATIALLLMSISFGAVAQRDTRVYYRATDGKKDNVYAIAFTRPALRNIVERKLKFWNDFMNCKPTQLLEFKDPFFTSEKVTFRVTNACTLEMNDFFGSKLCTSNPVQILDIEQHFRNDLRLGYGAEYLTWYEKSYLGQNCRMKI